MVCYGGALCALNKLYLHISGNISVHQSHTVALPADMTDPVVFSWAQHTGCVTHKTTASLESSNSDLFLKTPSSFSTKIQFYKTPVFIFQLLQCFDNFISQNLHTLVGLFWRKTISQPQHKSEAITKHQATSVSELRRERNCSNKQLCFLFL